MNHKLKSLSLLPFILIVGLMPISGTSVLLSLVTSSSDMVLTVQTDRLYYLRGEVVKIFGTVTHINGTAIEGATIAIEVKNPRNSTIFLDIVYSTSNGSYSDNFRLSSIASVGRYTVYTTASKTGYPNVTQSTFFYLTTDDLFIVDVEPIQVLPDAKALIMNKETTIRVTIANGFSERKWADIRIFYDFATKTYDETGPAGLGVPLDPGLNRIYIPGGPTFPAQTQPWIPANQPPWFEWTSIGFDGNIRATVDPFNEVTETREDNNEAIAKRKIVESGTLKILSVPVYFPEIGQGPFNPSADAQAKFTLATYPVANNKFVWTQSPAIPWPGKPPASNLEDWLYSNVGVPITIMAKILGYDRAVIVIQNLGQNWNGIAIGMLRTPENRVPVFVVNEALRSEGLVAHEIGHTYYLWHPHDIGPPVYDAVRFWVAQRDYEQSVNTFMSYRSPPLWIDKGRFDNDSKTWIATYRTWLWNLFDQFKTGVDPEIIVIRGVLFKNSTIKANDPWYRLPQGTTDIAPGTSGNYTIVLLDNQHRVLNEFGFNASFTYFIEVNETLTEVETDSLPFVFNVPYVNGTFSIEIRNATGYVLASKTISSNPPSVNVTFPNGGEILLSGDNHTITWEAFDLDGDMLTYTVAYSQDGGENWVPLALDISGNSYNWNTKSLPTGTNYMVKVMANDGINTGEDTSNDVFTLGLHDIAITNITLSKEKPSTGEKVYINITVQNKGHFTETFNVSTYYTRISDPLIGTQTITIVGGENATLIFEWTANTTGRYQILANTTEIPNDIDPTNNIRTTILYVGYGENPGSYTSESINGFHMASFIFTLFASVMILAVRNNKEMPLSEMPASIIKQNLHQGLLTNKENMWQDQIRRRSI